MAADRIKGITIEIDGNTTGLQSALSDVNKEIKDTSTQLKDVEKLLKMDPGNMDLLEQKQKLLGDQVSNTKEKLEKLKQAQEQMNETKSFTPEQQEEYDNLQREIIETESNLKNLETQTDKNEKAMSGFTRAGDAIKDIGDKAGELGNKLMPATAAITGVAVAAGAAWKEVDDATDKMITMTGATGEHLDDLKEQMENVATTVPTTFGTAAEAVGQVSTKFGLAGDELGKLSAQFVQFAVINKTNVVTSVDNIQRTMAAFGVSTDHAGQVMDLLTAASQRSGTSVDTLLSTISSNQTALNEMGLSLEQSVGFLASMSTSGVATDLVLAGLKKAMQNASKEGKPMNEMLAEAQTAMENAGSRADAMQIAIDTFGQKAGPAILQGVEDSKLNLGDFTTYLEGWEGSTKETFEATLDAPDKLTTTMNALKTAGAELADMVLTTLAPYIEDLAKKVEDAVKWFSDLDDGTKQIILGVLGFIAVLGPLLKLFQGISGILSVIVSHPIIALIAAVIAGVILLYNKCEPFRDFVDSLWNDYLVPFGEFLAGAFTQAWETVSSFVTDTVLPALEDIKEMANTLWNDVLVPFGTFLGAAFKEAWQGISNFWNGTVADCLQSITNKARFLWKEVLKPFGTFISKTFQETWANLNTFWNDTILPIIGELEKKFSEFKDTYLSPVWEFLQDNILIIFKSIHSFWKDTFLGALKTVGKKFTDFKDTYLTPAYNFLKDNVLVIFQNMKNFWSDTLEPAISSLGKTFQKLKNDYLRPVWQWIDGTFSPILEGIETILNSVISFVTDVFQGNWESAWNNIVSALGSIFDTLKTLLLAPINAVIGIINNMIGAVESAINGIIDGINSALHIVIDPIRVPIVGEVFPGFDWNPGIGHVDWARIPQLAKGGVLSNGSAIIAEAGPELLTMQGGKAVVTPLTSNSRTYNAGGITMNIYAQPGQDVRELANLISDQLNQEIRRQEAVFA